MQDSHNNNSVSEPIQFDEAIRNHVLKMLAGEAKYVSSKIRKAAQRDRAIQVLEATPVMENPALDIQLSHVFREDQALSDELKAAIILELKTKLQQFWIEAKHKDIASINAALHPEILSTNFRASAYKKITEIFSGRTAEPIDQLSQSQLATVKAIVEKLGNTEAFLTIRQKARMLISEQPEIKKKVTTLNFTQSSLIAFGSSTMYEPLLSLIGEDDSRQRDRPIESRVPTETSIHSPEIKVQVKTRNERGKESKRKRREKKLEQKSAPSKSSGSKKFETKPTKEEQRTKKKVNKNSSLKTNYCVSSVNNISQKNVPQKLLTTLLNKGIKFTPDNPINIHKILNEFDSGIEQIISHLTKYRAPIEPFKNTASLIKKGLLKFDRNELLVNSSAQRELTNFLTTNELIVKPADKNLGLTIMDKNWYNLEVFKHLTDTSYYKLEEPNFERIKASINNILIQHKVIRNSDLWREIFPSDNFTTPIFYVIPKLHKTPIKTRPIVPSTNWITTKASKWLDKILSPFLQKFNWIVPNSQSTILELQAIQPLQLPVDLILAAADVESLYTNIDIKEGINKVYNLIWKFSDHKSKEKCLLIKDILEWVLTNNYFQFDNKWYHQIKGTAMGTNCAPVYANLFLAAYEMEWKELPMWSPIFYNRYLDDLLILLPNDSERNKAFIDKLNMSSPSLKFTFEIDEQQVSFLDMTIYKSTSWKKNLQLNTKLYEKPTNKHLYTDPSTFAPHSWKYNWITGENIRLLRIHSNQEEFDFSIVKFRNHLLKRGYPQNIIDCKLKYSFKDRPIFLTKSLSQKYLTALSKMKILTALKTNPLRPEVGDISDRNSILTTLTNPLRPKVEKLNEWFIYINNIPGRDQILKALDRTVHLYSHYLEFGGISPPKIIVMKGTTLMDICNKNNKKILLGSKQDKINVVEAKDKTSNDREELKENIFTKFRRKRKFLEDLV